MPQRQLQRKLRLQLRRQQRLMRQQRLTEAAMVAKDDAVASIPALLTQVQIPALLNSNLSRKSSPKFFQTSKTTQTLKPNKWNYSSRIKKITKNMSISYSQTLSMSWSFMMNKNTLKSTMTLNSSTLIRLEKQNQVLSLSTSSSMRRLMIIITLVRRLAFISRKSVQRVHLSSSMMTSLRVSKRPSAICPGKNSILQWAGKSLSGPSQMKMRKKKLKTS